MHHFIGSRNTSDKSTRFLSDTRALKTLPAADGLNWSQSSETSSTYSSVDVLRRTQYRTPVGSLENAVLCCALFTKPYHSNDGAVLLRVCVAMGMFCIATSTCRLVLLRIGYQCWPHVGGFHGRLPQLYLQCSQQREKDCRLGSVKISFQLKSKSFFEI
jgi:hypothetical protein